MPFGKVVLLSRSAKHWMAVWTREMNAYRALKLSTLATAALDYVRNADIRLTDVAPRPARNRSWCAIAAAVAVGAVAVDVGKAAVCARPTTLAAGPRLLIPLACRSRSAAASATRRDASTVGSSRVWASRCWLWWKHLMLTVPVV